MEKKIFLLGATENNTLVFAEACARESQGQTIFSVSFKEVEPVAVSDEVLRECAESYLEGLDDSTMLDLLKGLDCPYSNLTDTFMNESIMNYGVEELIDISLYPECYNIPNVEDDIYFRSLGGGQCDNREELIPINSNFSKWLYDTWDSLHLQYINGEKLQDVFNNIDEYMVTFDEYEWIENWLIKLEEEGVL